MKLPSVILAKVHLVGKSEHFYKLFKNAFTKGVKYIQKCFKNTSAKRISCHLQITPCKGLVILILFFLALEYIVIVSDTTPANKAQQYFDNNSTNYGPLLKTLLFKNIIQNNMTISTTLQLNPILNISVTAKLVGKKFVENGSSSKDENSADVTLQPSLCPNISEYLHGKIEIQQHPVPSVQTLESRFSWLQPGGHWAPHNCSVEKKVAIVIPFRCRGEHLLVFLQHMHPFLQKQQLDYTIFVVEQDGVGSFNRAMLMNIGYTEALKLRSYDCFIFHDIDLLPEDDRNLYTCPEQPRHMSVAVDTWNYTLPYTEIFGGVSAVSSEHFKLLNGFSNSFWGWGGEDDDMSNRIRYRQLDILRYPIAIARYTMLTHKKDSPNPSRVALLKEGRKLFDQDGLNNLTYELLIKRDNLLYTWILVKLTPPQVNNQAKQDFKVTYGASYQKTDVRTTNTLGEYKN